MAIVDQEDRRTLLTRATAPDQLSRVLKFLDKVGRGSLVGGSEKAHALRNSLFITDFSEIDNTKIITNLDNELSRYAQSIRVTYDINQKEVRNNLRITPRGIAMLVFAESLFAFQGNLTDVSNLPNEQVHTLTHLLSTNLANTVHLTQTDLKDVSPVFQEKALARHMMLANLGCLEQVVRKQQHDGEVLSILDTNNELRASLETILQGDDVILKAEVLDIFDLMAQNTRVYSPDGTSGHTQTSRYQLGLFFQKYPNLAKVVAAAQKSEKKIQGKSEDSYYSANVHPSLGELLSEDGEQLVRLLQQLEGIPCFPDTSDKTGFARAYESLQQEESAAEPESFPLGIVKAFLFSQRQHDTAGEAYLLKRILMQALAVSPELFGPYAQEIRDYLAAISQKNFFNESSVSEGELKAFSSLTSGDALPGAIPNGIRNRILHGDPVVIDISTTALGDGLLLCTNVYDIAQAIRKMGTKNKFTVVVSASISPVAKALLKDIPEVLLTVGPGDTSDEDEEQAFLQDLATDGMGRKGTIFKFYATRSIYIDDDYIYQPFYLPVMPEITDPEEAYSWSTYRRQMQANISTLAGTVLFDPQHPNESEDLRRSLLEHIQGYLDVHPQQQIQLDRLRKEHAGGYICLVTNGSTAQKSLPKSAQSFILDAVSDYCRKTDTAVVVINTQKNTPVLVRQGEKRVETYETGIDNDIFYAASFLAGAKAVIGPDTFLTHLAEFLPTAVLDLHVDSHPSFWRLDERMHTAQSFLVNGMIEENAWIYDPADSALYADSFTHPFVLGVGRRKRLHSLVRTVQESFAREIQREIGMLLSQVA